LLLPLILGSSFACSKADDPLTTADPSNVEITLQRSACFGACPDYKVTLHGDGRVVFTTSGGGVIWPGTHEDWIAPETLTALLNLFRNANFFHLRNSYRAEGTDHPTYVLTVDTGQRRKSIEDYVGREVGMPMAVTKLERAVDTVAGTERWVRGNAGLIAWLEARNFDFHSSEAAELAVKGARGWPMRP
jgi:hypothetical protein